MDQVREERTDDERCKDTPCRPEQPHRQGDQDPENGTPCPRVPGPHPREARPRCVHLISQQWSLLVSGLGRVISITYLNRLPGLRSGHQRPGSFDQT